MFKMSFFFLAHPVEQIICNFYKYFQIYYFITSIWCIVELYFKNNLLAVNGIDTFYNYRTKCI